METETLVPLGKVVGPHGIRGLVKIIFYSGQAPDLGPDPSVGCAGRIRKRFAGGSYK